MRNSPTYYKVVWFIGFESFLIALFALQVKTRKCSLPFPINVDFVQSHFFLKEI